MDRAGRLISEYDDSARLLRRRRYDLSVRISRYKRPCNES